MDRVWSGSHFTSNLVEDDEAGWSAIDLHVLVSGASMRVARVCFWDATGQFTFQTFSDELPLTIIEDLILEAKERIRVG